MYSAEQRAKVIVTFARFGCSTADTIAKLGYPSRVTLHETGGRSPRSTAMSSLEREHRRPRCSDEAKRDAVNRYPGHGKSLARTQ